MTQGDIQTHYREHWDQLRNKLAEDGAASLAYSSPVADAVIYPIYERLIRDLGIGIDGRRVLDIGCGSGRWIRFFLDRFTPATMTGIDFAETSVQLLREWSASVATPVTLTFETADITSHDRPLNGTFDVINVGNVLFHVPESDKFDRALKNIAGLLAEGGRVVTTEYLPRVSMRTEWMFVRSRYEFEAACARAGLDIIDIRACAFFSNDPMGIDGPDDGTRRHFNAVRTTMDQLLGNASNEQTRQFFTAFLTEIESACLDFCRERMAAIDMPAQKLVVLQAS